MVVVRANELCEPGSSQHIVASCGHSIISCAWSWQSVGSPLTIALLATRGIGLCRCGCVGHGTHPSISFHCTGVFTLHASITRCADDTISLPTPSPAKRRTTHELYHNTHQHPPAHPSRGCAHNCAQQGSTHVAPVQAHILLWHILSFYRRFLKWASSQLKRGNKRHTPLSTRTSRTPPEAAPAARTARVRPNIVTALHVGG